MMSDSPDRQMNVDQLERELRKLHQSQRDRSNDPLDELARIVQQEDPFAIAGARRVPPVAPQQAYGAPAQATASQPALNNASRASVDARLAEFRAMLDQRAPRPAAPVQTAQPSFSQEMPTAPPSAPADPFRQPTRPITASQDIAFNLDDVPDDIRLPRSYAEREPQSRRASPLIRVAMPLLAVALIGGGGVYAYSRFNAPPAGPQTASAPLIKAPTTPAKVAPPAPNKPEEAMQASRVLEPKAEDPKAPQAVVSKLEQPVDLKQAAPSKDGPRVIPLETGQGAPVVVLPDPKPITPATPAAAPKPVEPARPAAPETATAPKPVEQAAIPAPKPVEPSAPVETLPAAPAVAVTPAAPETPPAATPPAATPPAATPPVAEPEVALVQPNPETPVVQPPVTAVEPPVEAAPAVAAPAESAPATISQTRMKAVAVPVSLATIADEDLPGPGITDKPRRVKSVIVDTTDPSLTRSVRPAGAQPAAARQEDPLPAVPAPEAMPLPQEPDAAVQEQIATPAEEAVPAPKAKPKVQPRREASANPEKPAAVRRAREPANSEEQPPRLRNQDDAPISLEPGEAAAARTPTERTGSGFAVQFSAPNTEVAANAEVARVKSRFGVTPRIIQATVNGRTVYRVRAAGLSRDRANALCSDVKSAGGNCFVSNTN
jgi:hypothetical protein